MVSVKLWNAIEGLVKQTETLMLPCLKRANSQEREEKSKELGKRKKNRKAREINKERKENKKKK